MKYSFAILLTSLLLAGCTSLGLGTQNSDSALTTGPVTSTEVTTDSVSMTESSVSSAVLDWAPTVETVRVPASAVTPTAVLLQLLDVAGCDFAAIQMTEGTTRKGSSTLAIACK